MSKDLNENFLFSSFRIIQQFSAVSRYSRDRLICPENDLEHTGWVVMWSYFFATEIQNRFNEDIDFAKLMCGAAVHDIDEALTGDIPRPTKYYNKKIHKAIKGLENKSVKTIQKFMSHTDDNRNIFTDWENAKGPNSLEQKIVKIADFMSVVYKVWLEVVLLGNKSFIIVAEEVKDVIVKSNEDETTEIGRYINSLYDDAEQILDECISSAEKVSHLVPKPLNIET